MKKGVYLIVVVIAAYTGWVQLDFSEDAQPQAANPTASSSGPAPSRASAIIAEAFRARANDVQVAGSGVVTKVLRDDNAGSAHQRFILELDSGHTVLVAHNIDLAPRIPSLRAGDAVGFNGVYEYNDKGGVIHWTHDDPEGRHEAGWLVHNDKKYH